MKQELQELQELPLASLIAGPLNAAIEAQRDAALSTATFVEQVAFEPANRELPFFRKPPTGTQEHKVREAVVSYKQDVVTPTAVGATPPFTVTTVARELRLPFISLFNVPTFEIGEVSIDFNVQLRGLSELEAEFKQTVNVTATTKNELGLGGSLGPIPLPVRAGTSMKVKTSSRTQFGLRFGEGHEAQYDLHVTVKATQGRPPAGIEKLLSLAERIVDSSERARAEADQRNAAAAAPAPAPADGGP